MELALHIILCIYVAKGFNMSTVTLGAVDKEAQFNILNILTIMLSTITLGTCFPGSSPKVAVKIHILPHHLIFTD